jgi:hypothetical protein
MLERSMRRKAMMKAAKTSRAVALMRRLAEVGQVPPINPDFFYRLHVLPLFLGLERSQVREAINSGELPPLVSPTDSGRALGYYGRTILDLQRKRQAKADAA